ncbi:MAG: hypothetical protein EAZ81_10185 [Verrucomicrobia bacterium]|nr:MAG: hypothetical protein EAZ81_10185 [Verrucomicrobiota bacterium]
MLHPDHSGGIGPRCILGVADGGTGIRHDKPAFLLREVRPEAEVRFVEMTAGIRRERGEIGEKVGGA